MVNNFCNSFDYLLFQTRSFINFFRFFCQGGQTPMHVATYYGNVTLVLILLQHGGSPDITNVVRSCCFSVIKSEMHFIVFCLTFFVIIIEKLLGMGVIC